MKISVLLPYKENFSPLYPGAVSLFVFETSIKSLFKKKIIVYGSTEIKKKFPLKYIDIKLKKKSLTKSNEVLCRKIHKFRKRK